MQHAFFSVKQSFGWIKFQNSICLFATFFCNFGQFFATFRVIKGIFLCNFCPSMVISDNLQSRLQLFIDTYYIDQNALNTPGGLGHSVWRKIWTGHFSKGPVPPTRFGAKFEREGVPMLERMWPIQILRQTEWPKPPGVSRAFWSV